MDIEGVIKEYYEQYYAHEFSNLDGKHWWLEVHKFCYLYWRK